LWHTTSFNDTHLIEIKGLKWEDKEREERGGRVKVEAMDGRNRCVQKVGGRDGNMAITPAEKHGNNNSRWEGDALFDGGALDLLLVDGRASLSHHRVTEVAHFKHRGPILHLL